MKTFSILTPTRERPLFLRQHLESIAETVKFPQRITVLIAYDDDDSQTKRMIPQLERKFNFKIRWFKRGRSNFINSDYYNWLAGQTSSEENDYLFVSADDVRFIAMEWDRIIEAKVEMFCSDKPDRLVGIGIKDNTPKPKPSLPQFPCFPLVTKESFKHFGFVLHPFVPTWGADYLFYLLYTGAHRYLAIDDRVYMNHIGIHTKTGPKDATAKHVEKVFNQLKMNPKHNVDVAKITIIPRQVQDFVHYLKRIKK